MSDNEPRPVYTLEQLCERWNCSRPTVVKAIKDGHLKSFILGKRAYRFTLEAVEEYEAKQRVA